MEKDSEMNKFLFSSVMVVLFPEASHSIALLFTWITTNVIISYKIIQPFWKIRL